MKYDGVFFKTWQDDSRMQISFVENNGPIIDIDLKTGSEFEKEIDELSKVFYGKILDQITRELLKDKGFKEET